MNTQTNTLRNRRVYWVNKAKCCENPIQKQILWNRATYYHNLIVDSVNAFRA